MAVEMGELVVGAYLKEVAGCDFVDYNVRPTGGGRTGQHEFDVLGLHFREGVAFLCEVATHLDGLNYGGKSNQSTLDRITAKHRQQRLYARNCLQDFPQRHFMFWAPRVPIGFLTKGLAKLKKLELVINEEYGRRLDALQHLAAGTTRHTGNDFFRALQIMEHVRR